MADRIIPFHFDKRRVRVSSDADGNPLFVARDVANVLGYTNPLKAIRDHCKGVTETFIPTAGGQQKVLVIHERDVYRLILRSKLPSAEAFEEWVVGEVLPQIRRTGSFSGSLPGDLPGALRLAADLAEKAQGARRQLELQAPVVRAHERIASAAGLMPLTDAGKTLGIPPRSMFPWLSQLGWIYCRPGCASWLAYQSAIQSGWLVHKVRTIQRPDGSDKATSQVVVTPKGLAKLAELLESNTGDAA